MMTLLAKLYHPFITIRQFYDRNAWIITTSI